MTSPPRHRGGGVIDAAFSKETADYEYVYQHPLAEDERRMAGESLPTPKFR